MVKLVYMDFAAFVVMMSMLTYILEVDRRKTTIAAA